MSEITAIRPADLRAIERSLERIGNATVAVHEEVREVHGRVATVESDQRVLAHNLTELAESFAAFVEADAQQKELQLAETRIVKVRQELETRFGYYAEVRRRATGILQALDAGLVSHETIQHTTEDLMMSTPGYWLAPALVALAGWIRGDRGVADRAVAEALRRDGYKTALYFALILHRYGRTAAAAVWLHQFFSHQDPARLDREFVVLLDVVANGFFGPEARSVATEYIGQWLGEMSQQAGFVNEQEQRWEKALAALRPAIRNEDHPTLARCSPTWDALRQSLSHARVHQRIADHFRQMFTGEIVPLPRLAAELDVLLRSLVSNFDDEELPLRAKERELQLIIDADGNRAAAEQRFAAEQDAFEEKVTFTELLTNAAMHPEISKASLATQRYGVALSRPWIAGAHARLAAAGRALLPREIVLTIEGWEAASLDGTNEGQLANSQREHLQRAEAEALAKIKLSVGATAAPFIGGALIVYGLVSAFSVAALLLGVAAVAFFFWERKSVEKRKAALSEEFRRKAVEMQRVLKLALAEIVQFRAAWERHDAEYENACQVLNAISPDREAFAHVDDPNAVPA